MREVRYESYGSSFECYAVGIHPHRPHMMSTTPLTTPLRKLRDQAISSTRDRVLEIRKVLRRPMRMLVDSISHTARESNIQHIRLVMSRVPIDARTEAFRCERNTGSTLR